ncbi:MAG: hypothetical protein RLZZ347_378 [Candidatus Parcubacteria bacterium]|jgi:predicted RNA methylase
MSPILLKLTFVPGLQEVVLAEIAQYPNVRVFETHTEKIYLDATSSLSDVGALRSVLNVYAIRRGDRLNPSEISDHKSILGDLVDTALKNDTFRTYHLSCAGSQSDEIRKIHHFITTRYKLVLAEEADMEMYIGKSLGVWEVGVRLTARPLSVRDYRVANIKGGLNPTTAYAMNTFCRLDSAKSYLNIFSGSGTLLVEAGITNSELKLVGFDTNGTSIALAVKNVKKAGLLKSVTFHNADIATRPALGKFDAIASDLPFGMQVSKGEDLRALYAHFVEYSESVLKAKGVLVVYTSEHALLESLLAQSKFKIVKTLDLTVPTSGANNLHPKIVVCVFK